jgi:hypothetical protein
MEKNGNEGRPELLKHYTGLAALAGILESGELCPGDPSQWEDRNDAAAAGAYQRKTGADQIRVFSFAEGPEQIHHWFYYAKKDNGVCIHFKTPLLLEALQREPSFSRGPVDYVSRDDLPAKLKTLPVERIPFIKRRPYETEQEYRVVWTGAVGEKAPAVAVTGLIEYITLAPGLAGPKGCGLHRMLETKYGLTVKRSRLLEDADWIRCFEHLTI